MARSTQQSNVPAAVRQYIESQPRYAGQDINMKTDPVYSTVRFAASVAANQLTLAATSVAAFSYGLNGDMGPAGRAGTLATQADTNLQAAGQTRDQSDVFIYGLSAYFANGEPALAQDIVRETDLIMATNGSISMPIGTIDMFPYPGGLYGQGNSKLLVPGIATTGGMDGGEGGTANFWGNGLPTAGSFRRFDLPIFWAGLGTGPDSSLNLLCTPRRAIVKTLLATRAAAAGIAVASQITAAQAYVDIRWVLHSVQVQKRSVNVA